MLSALQAEITLIIEKIPDCEGGGGEGEGPSRTTSLLYLKSYAALDVCRVSLAGIL